MWILITYIWPFSTFVKKMNAMQKRFTEEKKIRVPSLTCVIHHLDIRRFERIVFRSPVHSDRKLPSCSEKTHVLEILSRHYCCTLLDLPWFVSGKTWSRALVTSFCKIFFSFVAFHNCWYRRIFDVGFLEASVVHWFVSARMDEYVKQNNQCSFNCC